MIKTIFDLREKTDDKMYSDIKALFYNSRGKVKSDLNNFENDEFKIIELGDNKINTCIGCWDCWLKTPGRCVMKDWMSGIYYDYVNSDTVIILMDTAQGFINHTAKAFLDRTIPHFHPHIELVDGECHHVARYGKYPDMVFLYETEGLINNEEEIIEDYLYRTAFHFKCNSYRILKNEDLSLKALGKRKANNGLIKFQKAEKISKLVIYNGSPRIKKSNSEIILNRVVEFCGDKVEIRDLKEKDKWDVWAEKFEKDEHVMFFMPLYVHAMPSHVMRFFEKLVPSSGSLSFFVQSGFPESSQSYFLEAYFEKLSQRLERKYLGTAIKGGVESLQFSSEKAKENILLQISSAISNLINDGEYNDEDIRKLGMPVRFPTVVVIIFKLFAYKLINKFWDNRLNSNFALDRSFDRPYIESKG